MSRAPGRAAGWYLLRMLLLVGITLGCRAEQRASEGRSAPTRIAEPRPLLLDRATDAGLDFRHVNGMVGERSIVEEMGAGAAVADFDNDGDLDVYLVQGHTLDPDTPGHGNPSGRPRDRLFRNDLDHGPSPAGATDIRLRFTDVTDPAIPVSGPAEQGIDGYGMGVATGDVDNDGWIDLYITQYGPDRLLRNRGSDTGELVFEDWTSALPPLRGDGDTPPFSVPAVFFDFDRDGWLDLFVGAYVAVPTPPPTCYDTTGAVDYCSPSSFRPQPDRLLHNLGPDASGRVRFRDVTGEVGLRAEPQPTLGAIAADFDGDGWQDLFVANDGAPNRLWMNRGGTFADEALYAGCAVDGDGRSEGSMGVVAADFDHDGDLDLFLTHLITETNTLYRNDGHGQFDDVTRASGLGAPSRPFTAFGTGTLDADGDGWLDLLVVNGAVNIVAAQARAGDPYPLRQPDQLFRHRGATAQTTDRLRFEDVTSRGGEALIRAAVSRGAAFGDLDQDGDLDVVVVDNNGPARLLIADPPVPRPWLGLRLVGGAGRNGVRDMLGTRVIRLRDGTPVAWRWVQVGGSYASAHDPRVVFPLEPGPGDATVRVEWHDGTTEIFDSIPTGRYTTLAHGTGTPRPTPP